MEKSAKSRFVAQSHQLIEILVATDSQAEAQKIQDEALTVLDDAKLHSAVSDAVKKMAHMNNNLPKINPAEGTVQSTSGTSGAIETIKALRITYDPQSDTMTANNPIVITTTTNTNDPASQRSAKP